MSKERKIVHLDIEADNIEDVFFQFQEVKPRIKSVVIVAVLEPEDDDTSDQVGWYIPEEHTATTIGLMETLKHKLLQLLSCEEI